MRSRDLTVLGAPGTTIPGANDLSKAEHIDVPPRIDMRVPIFSERSGFTALPVGPCQCVHRDTEFPELDLPIDTKARMTMAWENLYDLPRDDFVELLGMLLVLSDQAYYHHRPPRDIFKETIRHHGTKEYQMAIVNAFTFSWHIELLRLFYGSLMWRLPMR